MGELSGLVFLGAGQMAEAIVRGVMDAGLVTADRVTMTDVRPERLDQLGAALGVRGERSNQAAVGAGQMVEAILSGVMDTVGAGEVIILAVKPQDVTTVLADVGPHVGAGHLLISIAAGVPIATLESGLREGFKKAAPARAAALRAAVEAEANPSGRPAGIRSRDSSEPRVPDHSPPRVPVIRVMPNTPCLVGAGMTAVARGTHASPEHEATALRIFGAIGKAVALPEKQLDAVTALSGSGPGYVAVVIEALIDGGVRVGLPRDVATTLAIQTVLGSAEMLFQTGEHPARLKDMVTSPGGTTIAGIHAMERGGVRAALIDAIVEATERSRQLGS